MCCGEKAHIMKIYIGNIQPMSYQAANNKLSKYQYHRGRCGSVRQQKQYQISIRQAEIAAVLEAEEAAALLAKSMTGSEEKLK